MNGIIQACKLSAAAKLLARLYRLVCLLVGICTRGRVKMSHRGACNTAEMEEDPRKLQSYPISVHKPKYQVKDGKIPLSVASSSSTSRNSQNSRGASLTAAELYLTSTTLCYKITGTGVSNAAISSGL